MEREQLIRQLMDIIVAQTMLAMRFQIENEEDRKFIVNATMKHIGPVVETVFSLLSTPELERYLAFLTDPVVLKTSRYLQSPEIQQSMANAMENMSKEFA